MASLYRSWIKRTKGVRLVHRRTLLVPTYLGAIFLLLLPAGPAAWWWICGERFLSLTDRLPGEVLVVEGWIGTNGVRAAAAEFRGGGYRYVVATGSQTSGEGWDEGGWSYAQGAANELARSGIPAGKIILAPARNTERERTYESAVAVWLTLQSLSIDPKTINVFTFGSHARRSRLIFAKVYAQNASIGVVSWIPASHADEPWWQSSERKNSLRKAQATCLNAFLTPDALQTLQRSAPLRSISGKPLLAQRSSISKLSKLGYLPKKQEKSMEIRDSEIPDIKLIVPTRFADSRGYFFEAWS